MREALALARQGFTQGEVPVGAVLVREASILGKGFNQPVGLCDPTAHAEMQALRDAARRAQNYRLPDTTLYVTIEPCAMCFGAIVHARVSRIVYGASEPKAGVIVSRLRLPELSHWNHIVHCEGGVLAEEAAQLMQTFFRMRREARRRLSQADASED